MKSQLDYNASFALFALSWVFHRFDPDNDFDTALSWSKSQMTGLYHSSDVNQSQTIEIPFDFQLQLIGLKNRTFRRTRCSAEQSDH